MPQQLPRLPPGRPRAAIERTFAIPSGLRAGFALNHRDLGIIAAQQRLQAADALENLRLVRGVFMKSDRVGQIFSTGAQRIIHKR